MSRLPPQPDGPSSSAAIASLAFGFAPAIVANMRGRFGTANGRVLQLTGMRRRLSFTYIPIYVTEVRVVDSLGGLPMDLHIFKQKAAP
jgi:hypothetical protein